MSPTNRTPSCGGLSRPCYIRTAPNGGSTSKPSTAEQTFRLLRAPALLARVYSITIPAHRGRSTELVDDLRRLGQLAAADARAAGRRDASGLGEHLGAHTEQADGAVDLKAGR